ncbi:hypothetical protein V8G54_031163 [Vigna mungo]|uniref:Uncharacterized protein n=1 Tax=Vigna mungo TaxID=3915 RepID=A0AAQ3RN16_VIGMU
MTIADDSVFPMDNLASCIQLSPQEENRIVSDLIKESELCLKEGNLYYVVSNRVTLLHMRADTSCQMFVDCRWYHEVRTEQEQGRTSAAYGRSKFRFEYEEGYETGRAGAETYSDVSNPVMSMMPTEYHDLDCDYTTLAVMQQRHNHNHATVTCY